MRMIWRWQARGCRRTQPPPGYSTGTMPSTDGEMDRKDYKALQGKTLDIVFTFITIRAADVDVDLIPVLPHSGVISQQIEHL